MGNKNALLIDCSGGLDRVSTNLELSRTPGYASELINYEPSVNGGYRRIDGFHKIGEGSATTPNGGSDPIKGVYPYADGVVAVQDVGIYFSTDGVTWLTINKSLAGGGNSAALAAAATITRASAGRTDFCIYEGNTDYGELIITDGINPAFYFKIVDSGSRSYFCQEVTDVAAPTAPRRCAVHGERVILAEDATNIDTLYYTAPYSPLNFTGGSSIQTKERIVGIKAFRNRLIIFGSNSISELLDINGTPAIRGLTNNVGAICGCSIQELGGDLIWLANDGIRTLRQTEAADDTSITLVSLKIQPVIQGILENQNVYDFSSVTVKEKSQYRLFYCRSGVADNKQKGILGTYKVTPEGTLGWEWSEIQGIAVSSAASVSTPVPGSTTTNYEKVYHGNYVGHVFHHVHGNDFDGTAIAAKYSTTDLDFNNIALRKSLKWIEIIAATEGLQNDIKLGISYDYGSTEVSQPNVYPISGFSNIALYGEVLYGGATYGGRSPIQRRVLVEGGGHTAKLSLNSTSTGSSYSINNIIVVYNEGKTR